MLQALRLGVTSSVWNPRCPSPVETAEVRGGRLVFEGVGRPQNRNSRAEAQMTTKIF